MGDETPEIMTPLVFLATFVVVFALVFGYTSSMFTGDDADDSDPYISREFDPEDIAENTFWYNSYDTQSGYYVNTTDWNTYWSPGGWFGTEPVHDEGAEYEFDSDSTESPDQTVHVYPLGEQVGDEHDEWDNTIMFYQSWGWWDLEYEFVTFDKIIENAVIKSKNVQSKVSIDLKGTMTVWFMFPLGSDIGTVLNSHTGFTIVLGQSLIDAVESTQNIWNTMTALLTFHLDTGSSMVNTLIAIPIWIMIAYITFAIVTRLIPFL